MRIFLWTSEALAKFAQDFSESETTKEAETSPDMSHDCPTTKNNRFEKDVKSMQ